VSHFCPLSQCDVECDGVQTPEPHVLDDHSGTGSHGNNRMVLPTFITETTSVVGNKWH